MIAIFETSPKDFFNDIGKKIIYQTINDNAIGYVETLYQENREIYEKLIQSKNEQIIDLKEQIDFLKKQISS
jgi:hypothetical protein